MDNYMDLWEYGLRIGAALLSGLFIGVEREIRNKNAGLKTNALVSLGAAVFVLVSLHFRGEPSVDITRVMGQVVTGIGFIGAGVILHTGTTVRGLTTAATVWCSAGAGCLAAVGLYPELLVLTIIIVFVNVFFGYLDKYINRKLNRDPDHKTED
ncbi:putative Mg2+ transporter-C (MgtC) family protein [Salinimicrobium catena]|uniref:Putative Mg2+ transporter-C (MgtC) family protein n=2 Tax=Salinimicrobium catena TaxID=390640 RepID=A0A1H5JCW1_9FLAO|nr:MgtC/SapB family protein [Salinimicrobium catena]SDK86685.1 putative Mg2+ transporter-C (MgtC) family protein [Salinimicrobium catena]SEE50385.1 putative Mg2+ transporter-C (MgtC) family protein [Salinimicrobium catena]